MPLKDTATLCPSEPALLSRKQAAKLLDMSPHYLANLASNGHGPDFIRYEGIKAGYTLEALRAWVQENRPFYVATLDARIAGGAGNDKA